MITTVLPHLAALPAGLWLLYLLSQLLRYRLRRRSPDLGGEAEHDGGRRDQMLPPSLAQPGPLQAVQPGDALTKTVPLPAVAELVRSTPAALEATSAPTEVLPQRVLGELAHSTPAALESATALAPTLAWLRNVQGASGEYLLSNRSNVIGRSSSCDVVVAGDTVSREHCKIIGDDNGWWLVAFSAKNGTFLNGAVVPSDAAVPLRNDDIIGLGQRVALAVYIPHVPEASMCLELAAAGGTVRGARRENQDVYHADSGLLAVADGVSGRPAGRLAARLAVSGLVQAGDIDDLADVVMRINDEVWRRGASDPAVNGLATTLDAAVLRKTGSTFWMHGIHVGDGIAVVQEGLEIRRLTRPHTLAAELVAAGQMRSSEESRHPERANLVRAIGLTDSVRPDIWQLEADPGQRYMMATDGLLAALPFRQVVEVLHRAASQSAEGCVRLLLDAALEAGAPDNVTVIVGDVIQPDQPAEPETSDQ